MYLKHRSNCGIIIVSTCHAWFRINLVISAQTFFVLNVFLLCIIFSYNNYNIPVVFLFVISLYYLGQSNSLKTLLIYWRVYKFINYLNLTGLNHSE